MKRSGKHEMQHAVCFNTCYNWIQYKTELYLKPDTSQ